MMWQRAAGWVLADVDLSAPLTDIAADISALVAAGPPESGWDAAGRHHWACFCARMQHRLYRIAGRGWGR